MSTTYRVLTTHLTPTGGTRTRAVTFHTWDEATAYADTLSPATDGTMFPDVTSRELTQAIRNNRKADQGLEVPFEYSSGKFFHGSRYAAILRVG